MLTRKTRKKKKPYKSPEDIFDEVLSSLAFKDAASVLRQRELIYATLDEYDYCIAHVDDIDGG